MVSKLVGTNKGAGVKFCDCPFVFWLFVKPWGMIVINHAPRLDFELFLCNRKLLISYCIKSTHKCVRDAHLADMKFAVPAPLGRGESRKRDSFCKVLNPRPAGKIEAFFKTKLDSFDFEYCSEIEDLHRIK